MPRGSKRLTPLSSPSYGLIPRKEAHMSGAAAGTDRKAKEIQMKIIIIAGLIISTAAIIYSAVSRRALGRVATLESGSWEEVWRERLKK